MANGKKHWPKEYDRSCARRITFYSFQGKKEDIELFSVDSDFEVPPEIGTTIEHKDMSGFHFEGKVYDVICSYEEVEKADAAYPVVRPTVTVRVLVSDCSNEDLISSE